MARSPARSMRTWSTRRTGSRGEDPDQQDPILPGAHQPGGERRLCGPEAGRQDLDQVEETEGAEIRFQVEDNGTGIPRELLGEIWEKGFSIRSSSGLGLNFVQQVVEQCGGSVELESVEREGTVVTVSLPPCEEDVCETGPV